ncbi:MAG TPA: 30S ribosome-binding factor RbfA [Symbiobacteriaceae bacterium]|nr:30S ribosome-binding factor RbfA [Symbiobacteriaceae bacterium]
MAGNRAARIADVIQQELAGLIRNELKDPRVGFVSIVKTEVSGDIRHAKVYVSVLGDEKQQKESLKALHSAAGFLRNEVGKALQIRYTPELHFALDDSIAHGSRIAQLLVQIQGESKGE